MKGQKDMTLKDELPKLVGAQYSTGKEQSNSSRTNEEAEPKRKHTQLWMCLVVKVKSDAVKNNIAQEPGVLGKLEVVKQEMARVNVEILGISELK